MPLSAAPGYLAPLAMARRLIQIAMVGLVEVAREEARQGAIQRAVAALYEAKRAGRDRLVLG